MTRPTLARRLAASAARALRRVAEALDPAPTLGPRGPRLDRIEIRVTGSDTPEAVAEAVREKLERLEETWNGRKAA